MLYSEVLVPGGTADQPYFCATRVSYCLEVAQEIHFHAALWSFTPCGMPSDQDQSQPEEEVLSTGAKA